MAARRLILVLILLLVISSIMAQIARPPTMTESTEATTPTDPTTTAPTEPATGGDLLRHRVGPSPRPSGPSEIRATAGDQLELHVSVEKPGTVAIPRLGLIENAHPAAPARFDLLLREPGSLNVRGPDGQTVVVIVTAAPAWAD
jgi:hypothetical protein